MKNMQSMKPRKNSKYEEGYYKVVNPEKYIGDLNKVIYRSSYELTFYRNHLDLCDDVKYWSVEPPQLQISYYNPVKKRWARYFPDAFCLKTINGEDVKCIIEIKPKSKLNKPKMPKDNDLKKMQSYQKKLMEYRQIEAKKTAAVKFAASKGMV